MPARDLDKAASRFLNALRRTTSGLETQRQRVLDRGVNAPRIRAGEWEVVNLTGDTGNDLDYYVYELGRLQAVAQSIIKVFKLPPELLDAQAEFDRRIPRLKTIRDPLTHPNDDSKLDDVGWFSSVIRTSGDGTVETLVDPRYHHHDAAMAYADALTAFLRAHVAAAIAASPPAPLRDQVVKRDITHPPHRPQ